MKPAAPREPTARQRPLVATKLRPPSNRGTLITRPKLLAALRQTLKRKLAVVHAPAGFGKTTLAAQWYEELKAARTPVAWLAIDPSDNDINRFLAYLVEALRAAEPDIGGGLRDVIEANPGSAVDFVLDALVSELSMHDKEFVLFVDDWHLVREQSVHDALRVLLTRSPPNLHVVVLSRTRSGVPLAKLRVQSELIEIDSQHLRFDLEESKTYLTGTKALPLGQDDVDALWRSTEGWAAALQLASLSLRESGDSERILQWTSGTANDIGEYLAETVVDKLPADQVSFMLKTSILERLSGDLCAAVTGEPDSTSRLDALEYQELFLLPLDEERHWFRYHHLFARFLQRRLRKQGPEMIRDLHLRASEWLATHGHTAEAVEHALLAGQLSRAVDLIERDAMSLVESSWMSTLLNLVSKIPRTALFDRPRLQMAIAWANCLTHHPQESMEALWHVERVAAGATPDQRELLLTEANVVRACSAVYCDQIQSVEALVRPCLEQPADYSPWTVGVAANVLAYRHIHTHDFGKVGPLLQWARDYQDRAQGLFSGMYGRCFQGMAAWRSGDLETARRFYQDAMEVAARTSGKQSNSARLASALLGQIFYEENNIPEAERLLRESRFLGFEGGVADFYMATYLSSARLAMLKGDMTEALAILKEGEETARALALSRLAVAISCERVRVRLTVDDVREAEHILSEIDARRFHPARAGEPDSDEIVACIALAKARLLCARKTPALALHPLREQIDAAVARGWKTQELASRILLAIALDLDGREHRAEEAALAVVNDAVSRGMMRFLLDEGPAFIRILERAKDRARTRGPDEPAVAFSALAQKLLTASRNPLHGLPSNTVTRPRARELTSREMEVLKLVDQGRSNKEIARSLSISIDTVKWYLKNIFGKLGVQTRTQAITETRRKDLLGTGP